MVAGGKFENMELVSSVDNPLLTADVRHMFENCLDTAENDLWKKLGKAWNLTKFVFRMFEYCFSVLNLRLLLKYSVYKLALCLTSG